MRSEPTDIPRATDPDRKAWESKQEQGRKTPLRSGEDDRKDREEQSKGDENGTQR